MDAWVSKWRQQKQNISPIFFLFTLFLLSNLSLGIINSSFLVSLQQDEDSVSSLAYPLLGNTTTQMESVERTSSGLILKTLESAQGDGSDQPPPTIFIYTIDPSITVFYDTEFKQLLENLGFSVIIEDRNSINLLNSSCFTNVSQFWLMNGDTGAPLEDSEVSLILDAWRNGTDIVLAGRNRVDSVNKISENFGVEFLGNVNTEVNHSLIFANHPIWINVTYLYTESPLPSLIIEPTSQAVNLSFLPVMWTLHALFENETGKVFWESSCLHFKDDFIGFSDNAQYISNLARYLQEPEISLQGLKNNSIVTDITPIKFQIVDDNLRSVQYNWNGGLNHSFDLLDPFDLFIISPPSIMGWNVLNLFVEDQWNHSKHLVYRFKQVVKSIPVSTSLPMIFIYSTDSTSAYYRDKYNNETRTLLRNLGFNVTVGDKSTIPILNSSHFVNVSQFWIMNGGDGAPFTDTEKNLILNAWRNGTNLVLAGDETGWYSNVNLIGKMFGVEYEGAYPFSNPQTPTFTPHPIWINVTTLYADPTLPKLVVYSNPSAQTLSTESGYNQHVLFENETGKVFWGNSFGNFLDEHIGKYNNSQYASNLARYLQEPEITILGAENNSLISNNSQIFLRIIDDNLQQVKFNWAGRINQSINSPFSIPLFITEGWNELNIYAQDSWNHTSHSVFRFQSLSTFPLFNTPLPGTIYNTMEGHGGEVISVAFSPNGTILASGSYDHTIKLWDVRTGTEISTLIGHSEDVTSVDFSPDGTTLASGSRDLTVKLWNLNGTEIWTKTGYPQEVHSVDFSPDGQILATGCHYESSDDKTIRLLDVSTGIEIKSFKGGHVSSVNFSPDGTVLASGSEDRTVTLWNISTGSVIRTLTGLDNAIYSVDFSPNGKLVAAGTTGGFDGTIMLWNVSSGLQYRTFNRHTDDVGALQFSPNGEILASGSNDDTIKLWNVYTGEMIRSMDAQLRIVRTIAFSPHDGSSLASGGSGIKLWNICSDMDIRTLTGHTSSVYSVAFSPEDDILASASWDYSIKLWNVSTGVVIRNLNEHTAGVRYVSFSPQGDKLASCSGDWLIKIWNVSTGTVIQNLTGHTDEIHSVVYSHDGKLLASSDHGGMVKLWNLSTGDEIYNLTEHASAVYSVAFSPNDDILASASWDHTIKLWNVSTGTVIYNLVQHVEGVHSVSFSPNGEILASGSYDDTIKLWNVNTGALIRNLTGHTHVVEAVTFSPDGEVLASASSDFTIKLWDVYSGELLWTLVNHTHAVSSVSFSHDGELLASGSYSLDRTIKLWNTNDIDCDSIADTWEIANRLDRLNFWDKFMDPDTDGLTNILEFYFDSDPDNYDTDGDGWPDGSEFVFIFPPDIILNFPSNNSVVLPLSIIDLTVSHPNIDTVTYKWNSSEFELLTYPYDVFIPASEGSNWLYIDVNSTQGLRTISKYRFYCDVNSPIITLIGLENDTVITNKTSITISLNDFSLHKSWFNWDKGDNLTLESPWIITPPSSDGYHWLVVYANDSVGHLKSNHFRWWINLFPTVKLLSPTNDSIQKNGSTVVLSIEDYNLDTTWYTWDYGVNQYFSIDWQIDLSLTDGWHWLTVYANDSYGILTFQQYHFYCEVDSPIVSLIGLDNDTAIYFPEVRVNITDFSLEKVWYNWDNNGNQTFLSPFIAFAPVTEGYHWLSIYANDSVGHLTRTRFLLYVNYSPVIEIRYPSNNSLILPKDEIAFSINDSSLTTVWYQWDSGGSQILNDPFTIISLIESNWHILTIHANDSWGSVTTEKYLFYILGSITVDTIQAPPSTAYDGESFFVTLAIANPESVSLNLTLYISSQDDYVLQGNGSQIIIAPGETQTIELKIKPRHASIHQLLISLYHGGEVYYQYTLEFNVQPQWMSPRFYIPFIILPILIILIIALISGVSFYFLRTRDRIRQIFLEEFSSTKEPVSLAKVQSSINAPSFIVNLGISSDQNLIVTPDGKIISKEHLTQHIAQIISSSTGPLHLLDISIKYPFSMSKVLSIVNKALSEGIINGKILENVFYPSDFIFQVSSFMSNQTSGNLSTLLDKFQINQKIINIAVNILLESDESIFTIYLNPQQDIFQVIYISEWNNIVRKLSSSEGFTPGSVFPRLDVFNWRSIFQNQKLPVLSYKNHLFTIGALQAYTPDHLDEITPIIQNVRRQLPQLSLTSRKQREIIQSFEQLLPIEPVHLPYYCQMDSAMIVKEQAAYVCVECNRKICPTCYNAMLQTGMTNCIHCNGDLVERPALQIVVDIERVDNMSGHDFENFLEGLFRTQMYRVENIQSSGDHGVDLVVIKGESRTGVQAKRYKPDSKIGNQVLVTLKGGGYFHDCDKLMVVTTSFFTPKAKEYAQKVGIELWDRDVLRRYLTKYNEHLQDIM